MAASLLACCAVIGWIFQVRVLVQVPPGSAWAMVLSTAVGCLLAAAALIVAKLAPRQNAVIVLRAIGGILALLGLLALLENLLGVNLGLDFPLLHARLVPDYVPAGRMGPNTAIAFGLLGLSFAAYTLPRPDRALVFGRVLLSLVLTLSLLGILTQFLDFRDLYHWFDAVGFVRMSPLTSVCMMLLGFGSWMLWNEVLGLSWNDERIEAMRILQTAAFILIATAFTTGMTGVVLLQTRLMEATKENLTRVAQDRLSSFEQTLIQRIDRAALLSNQQFIIDQLRDFNRRHDSAAASHLQASSEALLHHGFLAISFESASHRTVQAGAMISDAPLSVPIQGAYPAQLMWKQGYYLETRVPIADHNGIVGYIVSQQRLYSMDRLANETNHWGKTGEMLLCSQHGGGLACFPSRSQPAPYQVSLAASPPGAPIVQAARGQSGSRIAIDLHGRRVLASYGPVGGSGLAMVVKMETAEVLEPIRTRLEVATPLIGMLVLGGLWGMQRRVKPLIRKLIASQEYIHHLATHDALTGLPNRVLLEDRVEMAIRHAERNQERVALIMVDLDHFKAVNDTLGHAVGDQLLQAIAQRLRHCIRASDTAARFGGDEFMLLLPRVLHPEGTSAVARKLAEALCAPVTLESGTVSVTPSIGIACYPEDGADLRTLLRHADMAMYAAKFAGRNGFRVYQPDMMMLDPQPQTGPAEERP